MTKRRKKTSHKGGLKHHIKAFGKAKHKGVKKHHGKGKKK